MPPIRLVRDFRHMKTLLAGTASLSVLPPPLAHADDKDAFSFPLLEDLHFDKLACHDLEALGRESPMTCVRSGNIPL
jgi:hypothetical protein